MKLVGKKLGYNMMKTKLELVRELNGGLDLIEAGNYFFMVRFDEGKDKSNVISGVPWMIFEHYLAVRQCSITFTPSKLIIHHSKS